MSVRRLWLEGAGLRISLDGPEVIAQASGSSGFGKPPVSVRWLEGAGDGAVWRGSRQGRRAIALNLLVKGRDPDDLQRVLDEVSVVLAPENGPAILRMETGPGESWWLPVVRSGGLDWDWGDDTNGASWVQAPVTLESGDPYWTRERATQRSVVPAGMGRGLLGTGRSLTRLMLSSGQAMGSVVILNPGTAPAYPVVTVEGPALGLLSRSPSGEELTWAGTLMAGQRRVIDHRARTIVDPDDPNPVTRNRYDELGPAPRFWSIPPGTHTAFVNLTGASAGESRVTLSWRPRRWLVI